MITKQKGTHSWKYNSAEPECKMRHAEVYFHKVNDTEQYRKY